jgi:hypothetical protein
MKKIYSIAGTDEQHICHPRHAKPSYLEMALPKTEHQKCQDNGDATGTWVADTDALNEQARIAGYEAEQVGMTGLTIDQAEGWVKDRLQETTLDAASKVALGKIFRKLIAFLIK